MSKGKNYSWLDELGELIDTSADSPTDMLAPIRELLEKQNQEEGLGIENLIQELEQLENDLEQELPFHGGVVDHILEKTIRDNLVDIMSKILGKVDRKYIDKPSNRSFPREVFPTKK